MEMNENERLKSAYNYARDTGYADGFIDGYKQGIKDTEPDNDMIHLQKEQAYLQGWEEGREALKQAAIDAINVKNVNKGIISALQSIIEELPSAKPEGDDK